MLSILNPNKNHGWIMSKQLLVKRLTDHISAIVLYLGKNIPDLKLVLKIQSTIYLVGWHISVLY